MLQSQLFSRARDLCKQISDDTIQSNTGADAILNAIYKWDYKCDPLSVVSGV